MLTTPVRRSPKVLPWYLHTADQSPQLPPGCSAEIRPLVESFLKNGFVVIKKSISASVCDEVMEAFRRVEQANDAIFAAHRDADGHYPRIINLPAVVPQLFRLFSENRLGLALQDYLFQAETVLYTSLFYERGSSQPIHRDTPYFCTRPEYRYFGMWVALEDTDAMNGPLAVIPGGHLLLEEDREAVALSLFPSLDQVPAHSNDLWVAYQSRVQKACDAAGLTMQEVFVEKGDTILWHPQLPHGGAPIRDTRRTRFSLVMHTTPYNTPVYYQDVFFNPEKEMPTTAPWEYASAFGRRFVKHHEVNFGHVKGYSFAEFLPK